MGSAPENARHHAEQPQEQKAQDDQEHHVGAHGGGPVVKVNMDFSTQSSQDGN